MSGSMKRQRGQVQSRYPSLGSALHGGELRGRQLKAMNSVEELSRLLVGESEIRVSHFDQISHGAQPTEAQVTVGVGGHREMDIARKALQQVADLVMDLRASDHVEVVQHQHKRPGDVGQAVDKHRQNLVADRHHGASQASRGSVHGQGLQSRHRSNDISPELQRIVVSRIE